MHANRLITILFFSILAFSAKKCFSQDGWSRIEGDIKEAVSVDTTKKGKYTLVFINKTSDFNAELKSKLTDVFFVNYPKEAKIYNKKAMDKVIFVIDPGYQGVAAAGGGVVRFNPSWFKKNPGDIDVVTHEVMHLVQSYPNESGPGWITEGIADYVRFTLGIDNEGANWKLPEYNEKQSYEDAYRVTARFFYWIEKHVKKGIIKKLDVAMRNKRYTSSFWEENTGMSVDELWVKYAKGPDIS